MIKTFLIVMLCYVCSFCKVHTVAVQDSLQVITYHSVYFCKAVLYDDVSDMYILIGVYPNKRVIRLERNDLLPLKIGE